MACEGNDTYLYLQVCRGRSDVMDDVYRDCTNILGKTDCEITRKKGDLMSCFPKYIFASTRTWVYYVHLFVLPFPSLGSKRLTGLSPITCQALIPDVLNSIHPPSPPRIQKGQPAYARRPASQAALPGAVFEPLGDALSSAAVKSTNGKWGTRPTPTDLRSR
ncbi:uncharacterized protein RSE6_10621 [Rhynchosporium secalis]|uniref:Uncharacterized protein n=1 Tax=Rhynchosporium secalis TaxID=38038 RepID=A0A1E1MKY6_RHYSE|nr:uncharacterized protein RSE6_10621 [Rhynchosporium secalis]